MSQFVNVFRTASSRSSRSLAVRCVGRSRFYSTETTSNTSEESASEQKKEEKDTSKPSPEAEKLKAKEAEVQDLKSRLQYLQADFLNLQRNTAREKEQMKDYAITRFASDLLETVDVLALALKSVPPTALTPPEGESSTPPTETKSALQYLNELHTGVSMTHRLLLSTLFKYNVKPFDPTGDEFDPNRHEALYQAPIPNAKPGTVIDCQKTGYTIRDRVLRAAQVGVAQGES